MCPACWAGLAKSNPNSIPSHFCCLMAGMEGNPKRPPPLSALQWLLNATGAISAAGSTGGAYLALAIAGAPFEQPKGQLCAMAGGLIGFAITGLPLLWLGWHTLVPPAEAIKKAQETLSKADGKPSADS